MSNAPAWAQELLKDPTLHKIMALTMACKHGRLDRISQLLSEYEILHDFTGILLRNNAWDCSVSVVSHILESSINARTFIPDALCTAAARGQAQVRTRASTLQDLGPFAFLSSAHM